ncbi:MAG TPA: hypothetical protein EYH25_03030, partial [Thermotoga sp.]|nr:hypothetical protein [Thermotoga sp.]
MNIIKSFFLVLISVTVSFGFCDQVNEIYIPVPVGAFSNVTMQSSGVFILEDERIFCGIKSFNLPEHYLAQMIWIKGSGFLEYKIKNPLPENSKLKTLAVCFEIGSGDSNYPTELSIYINNRKIGSIIIPGNYLERKGKFPLPEYWKGVQYGKFISILIKSNGTYIVEDGEQKKISDTTLEDINQISEHINLRIGVSENAIYKNGISLFGEKFGDFPIPLILKIEYIGDKIYQPKIVEILDNPKEYENKTVILAVHPSGWRCPCEKSTPIPEGFSRSATMIHDDTGCIYGMVEILVGRIL